MRWTRSVAAVSDHGSIIIGAHRLRQLEQAMQEARGTFIVESIKVSVIPAWRVKRDKLAAEMQAPERPRLVRMR